MKRVMFGLFVVSVAMVLSGCSSISRRMSSTPKVQSTTPADQGYRFGQVPEQRQLDFKGPAYRRHLKNLQEKAMRHEEELVAAEYRQKAAIAKKELDDELIKKGIRPQSTTYAPESDPALEPTSYAPPSDSFRGGAPAMVSTVPNRYFTDQFGRRCFVDQYGRTFVFVPHGQPPPTDALFVGTR